MARPTLFTNRKLLKLAQRLQSKSMAVGTLELIWHVANETGNPIIGDADDVEAAADWRAVRGELVAALMECGSAGGSGFLDRRDDGRYEIHDYWHHAPDYVRKRAKREQERRTTGDEIGESDRSNAGSTHIYDQSATGQRTVTNRSLTSQNTVGSLKNGDFFRTPAPAPAPAPRAPKRDISSQPEGEGTRARANNADATERTGTPEDHDRKSASRKSPRREAGARKNGTFEGINNAVEKVLTARLCKLTDIDGIAKVAGITPAQARESVRQLKDRKRVP